METKVCNNCNIEFPATIDNFYKYKRGKYGVRAICIKCHKDQNKQYREENKEFIAEINKLYRQENKEKMSEYHKQYREKNKKIIAEYSKVRNKRYRQENNEKLREYDKRRRQENKEYFKNHYENKKAHYKLYRERTKEHKQQYDKEYYAKNKHKYLIYKQKRRSLKKQLPSTLTAMQWSKIKSHFNHQCAYCGMKEEDHTEIYDELLHQEHFIALSKGGEYTHNNIITACRGCNSNKLDKNFFKWYPQQEFYNKKREQNILEYLNYKGENTQQLSIF